MKISINKEVIILKGEVFLLVMAPIREILALIIFLLENIVHDKSAWICFCDAVLVHLSILLTHHALTHYEETLICISI